MRFALVLVMLLGSTGCARDATLALERFADRACACADKQDTSCAQGVVDDLVKFASQNKNARGDETTTKATGERMGMCLVRAGLDPNKLRSRLQDLGE